MYQTRTAKQDKIHQFLKEQFEMEDFLLSPLSRSALLLEDHNGKKIAFTCKEDSVYEIPVPPAPTPEAVKAFFKEFHTSENKPNLKNFDDVTQWWLDYPTPLTYQQALGLPDDLYRHFLSHSSINLEDVLILVQKEVVTEEEYRDIRLWYHNGSHLGYQLCPYGIDGTGNIYSLTIKRGKPDAATYYFYLLDDYYRFMNPAET